MAKSYQIVGQSAPAANSDVTLYEVPANTQFVAASVSVVNRSSTGSPVAIRLALVPSGQTLGNQHYVEYDKLLDIREGVRIPINIGMGAGTKVIVRATAATVSFTLGGALLTP